MKRLAFHMACFSLGMAIGSLIVIGNILQNLIPDLMVRLITMHMHLYNLYDRRNK